MAPCLSFLTISISIGSPESVLQTINELEENIQEGLSVAKKKQRETLLQAKVVGTSCDVCKPEDVKKLVNFAVGELGSIDIWVSNSVEMDAAKHLFCIFHLKSHLDKVEKYNFTDLYPIILFCICIVDCSKYDLLIYLQINNAGTNKGFRPLVNFSDEDITQVCSLISSICP